MNLKIETTDLGTLITDKHHDKTFLLLFGNKDSSIANLSAQFSQFTFRWLKQVHSNLVIPAPQEPVEADAHFTQTKNQAICARTADCIPILLWCPAKSLVCAIHAGWRGVANRITIEAIKKMVLFGITPAEIRAAIGPHIGFDSFEVDPDVHKILLPYEPEVSGKSRVKLIDIVKEQLRSNGLLEQNVYSLEINTFSDTNYHSYRRDGKLAGRQHNFVVMTD